MHEINIIEGDKAAIYASLLPQIKSLLDGETDETANMANVAAALKEAFGFFWVGFYVVRKNTAGVEELVLGPFQGTVACTRIAFGRGVCGTAWKRAETVIVEDVEKFPGHIACSSKSRSEIVVPLFSSCGHVKAVLDIDSTEVQSFDEIDKLGLESVVALL